MCRWGVKVRDIVLWWPGIHDQCYSKGNIAVTSMEVFTLPRKGCNMATLFTMPLESWYTRVDLPPSLDPKTTVDHTPTLTDSLEYEQNNTGNFSVVPGVCVQCWKQMKNIFFCSPLWIFSNISLVKLTYSTISLWCRALSLDIDTDSPQPGCRTVLASSKPLRGGP